ncbi:MAG: MFS transporter [Candidatus Cloacimonetes bacterium]|nr:MFS transporter [Candidatus Cloacimonadota bacterium]
MKKLKNYFLDEDPVITDIFWFCFMVGFNTSLFLVYLPLYLPYMGLNDLKSVGVYIATPAIVAVLSQNFWGWLCLRQDRFKLMMVLSIVPFLGMYGILAFFNDPNILFYFLFVHGWFASAFLPASQSLVTLLKPDCKGEVLGKLHSLESIGWSFGCLLVASILYFFDSSKDVYTSVFLIFIAIDIVYLIYFFLRFPAKIQGLNWDTIQSKSMGGYVRILKRKKLIFLFIFILIISTASNFFFNYFGRYLKEVLQGPEMLVGISMTLAAVLGAIFFPIVGRFVDKHGTKVALISSFFGYIALFVSLAFIKDPYVFVIVYSAPLYPILAVSINTYIAQVTAQKDRAIGFGLVDTIVYLAGVLAPLIGTQIFKYYGLGDLPMLALGVVLPTVILLPFLVFGKSFKQAPQESLT